jgi:YihY family inner membrane protein
MLRVNRMALRRAALVRFGQKAFNDWIFEFAGLLAYYLLLATVPIFVLLLGGVGFVLQGLDPGTERNLSDALTRTFPVLISKQLVAAATQDLKASSGALLAVGLIAALLFGSRLIVRMDECFTVIYRQRPRRVLQQNLIGLGLTALFVLLAPVMFLAAAVPALLTSAVAQAVMQHPLQTDGLVGQIVGFAGAYLAALLWLLVLYLLVPSKHVGLRHSWPGAALAALLLMGYEGLFPWIASVLLRPGNYGETAGFLLLLLSFFYYFAFLLLLGAEVNSWLAGHRETLEDLPTLLHQAIMHGELPELPADSPSLSLPPARLTLPKAPPAPDTTAPPAPPASPGAGGRKERRESRKPPTTIARGLARSHRAPRWK